MLIWWDSTTKFNSHQYSCLTKNNISIGCITPVCSYLIMNFILNFVTDPDDSCFTTEPVIDSCTPECNETCFTRPDGK